jgi:alkylation response protein AidB-like acyl-CoA dehydrogenase
VTDVYAAAERLVDEVLFPGAAATDAADLVPIDRLDALAAAGFYGLAGPTAVGGLGHDAATVARVVETLASGCVTTTFVWLQHHGPVRAVAAGAPELRTAWLATMCAGRCRAGIAIGGIRPGTAPLRARRTAGGWSLTGSVPWVTGWGLIDVVHTAAIDDDGAVVWLLVDAATGPSLRADRQRLVAVNASGTVVLTFTDHPVSADRVTGTRSYAGWQADDDAGLRINGSLALGVGRRCGWLLPAGPVRAQLEAELDETRDDLDTADPAALPAARAAAAELSWRAAGLLVVNHGSRSVLADSAAQRLAREALFLLVFGSRAAIKTDLLARLAR